MLVISVAPGIHFSSMGGDVPGMLVSIRARRTKSSDGTYGDFVNIQIFGTVKCQDTKKAQRYFKERRIPFQFIDITQKGLSKGELKSITAAGIDNLIDREGKAYGQKNLKYLTHDIEEELLKDATLLRTPVVRNNAKATVGYQPDVWKTWK
jgi:arsenate reductase (glutaredoxin)